ncbi:MAG: AsnC family transcriptional regulator [Paracoccaceae bacterium]|nr:AsnC family transcriptional regulator [Paracoccaceae bacterium]
MTGPARHMPAAGIDATDRAIINALQDGFPLSPRPYAEAAAALNVEEAELIARLKRLLDARILTRFGPFFDAAALGGAFCLCAMAVPEARFDAVAEQVNAHPEVAHNYQRSHRLNMWFVLATETPGGIAATADRIEAETGLPVFRFPKQHEFCISFRVAA